MPTPAAGTGVSVPCSGSGGGAAGLIAAVNAANAAGGGTIDLAAGCTYRLTAADNTSPTLGGNGLTVITSPVTLNGSGTTIAGNDTSFRIIGRAQLEIAHAQDSIGKPFPQAGQLAAARERARRINDELDQMAAPAQAEGQPSEPSPAGDPAACEPASLSAPASAARQEGHALPPGPASDPARPASREAPDPGNGHHHPGTGQAREVTADPGATAESAQPREHTQDRDAAATAEDPAPARHGARSPGSRHLERQHGPQAETTPADPEAGS